jgi:site-specific DNA recombinase
MIFSNPIYIGQIAHKGVVYEGQHPAIVDRGPREKAQQRLQISQPRVCVANTNPRTRC